VSRPRVPDWIRTFEPRLPARADERASLCDGDAVRIEPVVVAAAWRSRGIGTSLIRHVAGEALARGVPVLSIRPVARNVEAIACFLRAGFDVLGHVELFTVLDGDDARRWEDGVEMHGPRFRY